MKKVRCFQRIGSAHNPRGSGRKVMVFGTFDSLHKGHEFFLKEAKKQGDYLVVVVARDRTVRGVKGKLPAQNEDERKSGVDRTGIADKVLLGSLDDKYEVIRDVRPDVICLGYDQKLFIDGLGMAIKSIGINTEIRKMKAFMPEKYKTSVMKEVKEKTPR